MAAAMPLLLAVGTCASTTQCCVEQMCHHRGVVGTRRLQALWNAYPAVEGPLPVDDHILPAVLVHDAPVEGVFEVNLPKELRVPWDCPGEVLPCGVVD